MEKEKEQENNWSEAVEDLVAAGDTDAAISLLDSIVSNLQSSSNSSDPDPQLASALFDLAKLYSSKGFSLKADELESKAFLLRQRQQFRSSGDSKTVYEDLNGDRTSPLDVSRNGSVHEESKNSGELGQSRTYPDDACEGSSDDNWEAIADREPNELLSLQSLPEVSKLSLEDNKVQTMKRRGRGTFSYEKQELYSDQLSDKSIIDDTGDETVSQKSERNRRSSQFGTQQVLVLADFPTSTKTTDLEKYLEDFKDRGVVIRWVNDTTALAVFLTPSVALEARNRIRCPFSTRILDEDDTLLSSIPPKDLEPPRQRPQTSARTAQRLIAQGMGLKPPSTTSGTREFRKQEDDRRNRIVTRQKLRDEAWGVD